MLIPTLALISSIAVASLTTNQVPNLDVSEVVSFSNDTFKFRAVVTTDREGSATMVIEKIGGIKSKQLNLVSSWNLKELKGSENLEFKKGKRILNLKVSISGFEFDFASVKAPFVHSTHCMIRFADDQPSLECEK